MNPGTVVTFLTEADDVDGEVTFESIPKTELLDTSANRSKAQLASAMPSRRPPTKQRSKVRYSNFYNPGYVIHGKIFNLNMSLYDQSH